MRFCPTLRHKRAELLLSKQRGGSRQRDATRNDVAPRDNVSQLTSNTSRDDVRPVATISPGHDNVAPIQTM